MCAVQLRTVLQYADRTILVLVYVFLHGSEPYSLSAGIKMLFLVYALLHSSEPGSVITAFFFSFGICVFARLRTIICFKFTFYHVLVYVFLIQLRTSFRIVYTYYIVLVYALLHSSESFIHLLHELHLFWYMHYCTAPNQIKYDLHLLVCFGICVFAQLRTQ